MSKLAWMVSAAAVSLVLLGIYFGYQLASAITAPQQSALQQIHAVAGR